MLALVPKPIEFFPILLRL